MLTGCLCVDGYYEDEEVVCQVCNYKCTKCTSETVCTACSDSNRSVPDCDCHDGYYDAGVAACVVCHVKCATCVDAADNCVTCAAEREADTDPECPCPSG